MVTKTQAKHTYYAVDAARRLEYDIYNQVDIGQAIPKQWAEIATRKRSARKPVTLRLDEDVISFMKSLGPGYQARINDVLRVFMHAKLGALLEGPASIDAYLDEKAQAEGARPKFGEFEQWMEE